MFAASLLAIHSIRFIKLSVNVHDCRKFLKALRDQQLLVMAAKKESKADGSTLHQGIHQSVFMSAMVTSPSTKVSTYTKVTSLSTRSVPTSPSTKVSSYTKVTSPSSKVTSPSIKVISPSPRSLLVRLKSQ